jgi:hypothetical protein
MKLRLDVRRPVFDLRSPRARTPFVPLFGLLFVLLATAATAGEVTIVRAESFWRYLDDGSDQGTAWRAPAFDDSTWVVGETHSGFGEADEATIVRCNVGQAVGTPCDFDIDHFLTTYYRRTFEVTSPSPRIAGLTLGIVVDDGAAVYLNGMEIVRQNLPGATIFYDTEAPVNAPDEDSFTDYAIDPDLLVAGTNTLAVEIHQRRASSDDLSFDFRLVATDASLPTLLRGPYLQVGSSTGGIVRWRTDLAVPSYVRYGTVAGVLDQTVSDLTSRTEHEIPLTGLTPATRYYYAVGVGSSATDDITPGEDRSLLTAPALGDSGPIRIWVLGDSGLWESAPEQGRRVRDVYRREVTGGKHTDVWLMLGDNAYPDGTDVDHQIAVFERFPMFLEDTWLWTTIGNHEMKTAAGAPYFDIFTLPTAGEAGGLASGTEDYYSFDYGNIHFICLDSATWELTPEDPPMAMLTWVTDDAAATDQKWIIVFWHHPPYSQGTHDADEESLSTSMREDILPILEAADVDLILAGHSHVYERSKLIEGLYDVAATYDELTMAIDAGDGDPAGDGAYLKEDTTEQQGTVYAVVGSSSLTGSGQLNHPAMVVGLEELGSLVLDVEDNQLDARFLDDADNVLDVFRIRKIEGKISGQVTDSGTSLGIEGVEVRLYDAGGILVQTAVTAADGSFTVRNLSAGTYYLWMAHKVGYRRELYDDIPCNSGCDPTTGTAIVVALEATTANIDLALDSVPPEIFDDGFESGDLTAWD